ncbi:hypothetical protein HHI36_015430 [Cryptolaemus montrouzieri]|uniref:Uncharacterized protein n=1 Tax=Cryptolaemus montrouzieri TaxID=559131 RepID=A0ABD2N603_9CUCU
MDQRNPKEGGFHSRLWRILAERIVPTPNRGEEGNNSRPRKVRTACNPMDSRSWAAAILELVTSDENYFTNSESLSPKILDNDSHKSYSRRENATLNNNLEPSSSSVSLRVESIDNDFPESYPEHNITISKNHFDPQSSAS